MSRALGMALAFAALALGACGKKIAGDPETATRTFLERVIRGETAAAYKDAAFDFRAQLSESAFAGTARELGFVGARLVSLEPVEKTAESARLNATLKPELTEARQLIVNVHLESGAWRVFSVRAPRDPRTGQSENLFSLLGRASGFAEGQTRALPSEEEARRLVRDSMALFADALKRQSFAEFYAQVSKAWQKQLSEVKLQRAFQSFIDQHVELGGTADVEPIFDAPPHITMDGLLHITGHYPTRPFEVKFAFKYAYELPEWKLFGLDVYLRKAAAPATPAPSTPVPAPAAENPAP